MSRAHSLGGYLLPALLLISLSVFALSISIEGTLTDPSQVKSWLNQSQLDQSLRTMIIGQALESLNDSSSVGVTSRDRAVQESAESALPQSLVQNNFTTFLNSNYEWLEGKSSIPSFSINLSSVKQAFAKNIGQSVETHLANLQICTATQTINQENITDPLKLTCREAAITPQDSAKQATEQVTITSNFLTYPVLTARNLSFDGGTQTVPYYQRLSVLPKLYSLAQLLPVIFGLIAALSLLGIFLTIRRERYIVKRISVVMFLSALFVFVGANITKYLVNAVASHSLRNVSNAGVKTSLLDFSHLLGSGLVRIDVYFGIAYLIVAFAVLARLIITSKQYKPAKKISLPDKSSEIAFQKPQVSNPPMQQPLPEPAEKAPRLMETEPELRSRFKSQDEDGDIQFEETPRHSYNPFPVVQPVAKYELEPETLPVIVKHSMPDTTDEAPSVPTIKPELMNRFKAPPPPEPVKKQPPTELIQ
jgi:hypothetical protein